jgi:2-dehydro-3-deoxygalactonokinase
VTPAFIGLDWGTTALRAYLAGADGSVIELREAPDGILAAAGRFEETFAAHVADWPDALPVIAAGMIGSRQGWIDAPYCRCPAGLEEICKRASVSRHAGRTPHRLRAGAFLC